MINNIIIISVTLFSVIDMLGNIPLIISLRKGDKHIDSLKASIYAVLIMILMLFVGKFIFRFLGIEVSHFALAGSMLLFYFGTKMVLGLSDNSKNEHVSATVFPVAFPLIAGPGTLSTVMSFRADYTDIEIIIGILINAIIIFIVLKSASFIQKKLGANGINIIERLFGIILISIAIKMFIENLYITLELLK
jgi:multiple antibiotic resistance protein